MGAGARRRTSPMRGRVVEGDACSNHHFRAAKHRALDTPLWHFKLIITLEVARWSWSDERVWTDGGAAADRPSTMMRASGRRRRCLFQPPLQSRQTSRT